MTDGQSVSQYAMVSSPLWDLRPDITSCRKVAVLFLWGAFSDERTGVQVAVQSLNGPSRTEPVTILHSIVNIILSSSNLKAQVPVFIFLRKTVAKLYSLGH
jgi:hypothetical protein